MSCACQRRARRFAKTLAAWRERPAFLQAAQNAVLTTLFFCGQLLPKAAPASRRIRRRDSRRDDSRQAEVLNAARPRPTSSSRFQVPSEEDRTNKLAGSTASRHFAHHSSPAVGCRGSRAKEFSAESPCTSSWANCTIGQSSVQWHIGQLHHRAKSRTSPVWPLQKVALHGATRLWPLRKPAKSGAQHLRPVQNV